VGKASAISQPTRPTQPAIPIIWVTEGGDLGTADWGCLAGHCTSLCMQAARGGCVAGGSG